jgi:pantothenate kinase type III
VAASYRSHLHCYRLEHPDRRSVVVCDQGGGSGGNRDSQRRARSRGAARRDGRALFGVQTLFITSDTDTGVKVRYDDPSRLGADRLVNGATAFRRYGGPALIVDVGTAINLDVVSADGEFLGGIICPGIEMCLQSLYEKTARLPSVEFCRPVSLIGTNTEHCIRSGIYYGLAGMIDGIAQRAMAEISGKMTVIGIGGHVREIAAESRFINEINEDLTLEGLQAIWHRNRAVWTSSNYIPNLGMPQLTPHLRDLTHAELELEKLPWTSVSTGLPVARQKVIVKAYGQTILHSHLPARVPLTDPQRATLAEIGKQLGVMDSNRQPASPNQTLSWVGIAS